MRKISRALLTIIVVIVALIVAELIVVGISTICDAQTTAPLKIITSGCPDIVIGQFYSCQLKATGGTPPYHWSVESGALPPGITLSDSGVLSGTVTTPPQNLKVLIAGQTIKIRRKQRHVKTNRSTHISRIWYPISTNQGAGCTSFNETNMG